MITTWFGLAATVGVYYAAKFIHRRKPIFLLSPLLITPMVIVVILLVGRISYTDYNASAKALTDMLQPATIAFAVPLYKYFGLLKKHAAAICLSVTFGSVVAVFSSMWIAHVLKLNAQLTDSLIPHSVTTPIAMNVSHAIGGIPAFTAAFVVITGLFGAMIGPAVIRLFRIRSDIARGIMLGTSAHGAGTAKAFELSTDAGTAASLAMILAALFTLFAAPWMLTAVL